MNEFLHTPIEELIVKHILNEATAYESEYVKEWTSQSKENRSHYEQISLILEKGKKALEKPDVDVASAWSQFLERKKDFKKETGIFPIHLSSWLKIAAIFLLLLSAALIAITYFNTSTNSVEITKATRANVLSDTLADGSIVTLNKNSELQYSQGFSKGKTRNVQLKGEAFFSITPNKTKPFIIKVNDVQVTVVGTSFNIKEKNGNTEVIVKTGVVKVLHHQQEVVLKAGEKTVVHVADTTAPLITNTPDNLYNYYIDKTFVCDNTPLWRLAEALSEAYDVTISIEKNSVKNLPLNTTFNNKPLEEILHVIAQTFQVSITKTGNKITIR